MLPSIVFEFNQEFETKIYYKTLFFGMFLSCIKPICLRLDGGGFIKHFIIATSSSIIFIVTFKTISKL